MDLATFSNITISLLTLSLLEVVLGIDNLVFISVASSRLPVQKQKMARRFGLLFALATRLLLLASVAWLVKLTNPLFSIFSHAFSLRDLLLIAGGLFLIFKATREIHAETEEVHKTHLSHHYTHALPVILQIGILDIVFSFDSVFTAVGMTKHYWIMATAITIAILAMIFASEPLSRFIQKKPTFKMLAFSFLVLIGVVLIADGFKYDIPREYIYFAVSYALFVEILNTWVAKRKKRKVE